MKFWQSLAFVELDQIVELARFCEEVGFHGVSFPDHLITTQEQADSYLYQEDGNVFWNSETHWADPWVLASALASATRKLEFLSTIYILPLRDPFSAAKAISTAAYLSNDRITLGIGVGWQATEFAITGQDFHTRGKRCDEQLEIIRKLMAGEICDYQGQYYRFPKLQMSPGTRKPVPIFVGGYSDAAIRRAAHCDGWMATAHLEADLYPLLENIKTARFAANKPHESFEVWSGVINPGPETHSRLESAGLTMTNGANFLGPDGRTALSSLDDKKRRIEEFAKRFL